MYYITSSGHCNCESSCAKVHKIVKLSSSSGDHPHPYTSPCIRKYSKTGAIICPHVVLVFSCSGAVGDVSGGPQLLAGSRVVPLDGTK
ncbi:hypothetical protein GDO81_009340 [Engystomops pustulosus]|uniref:Uncharacterized protein n=1 Tax=Engystomops pustulosus TaxID=76066 RepID=A0AAV7BQZ9_ENGPU|nr:hypothetical protein GDO81_009340 [Engystomops pustulosus]